MHAYIYAYIPIYAMDIYAYIYIFIHIYIFIKSMIKFLPCVRHGSGYSEPSRSSPGCVDLVF